MDERLDNVGGYNSLCARLGKERGLSELWGTFQGLPERRKDKLTLFVQTRQRTRIREQTRVCETSGAGHVM